MRQDFREMLRDAVGERHKLIAIEAFGGSESTAKSELTKYLTGERGVRCFRIIDATYKFGNRELIRRWHEERLRHQNPAELLADIGEQLELLEHKFDRVREQAKELAEVIPLQRRK